MYGKHYFAEIIDNFISLVHRVPSQQSGSPPVVRCVKVSFVCLPLSGVEYRHVATLGKDAKLVAASLELELTGDSLSSPIDVHAPVVRK